MWQAVLNEDFAGRLSVCIQYGDDWENAQTFATISEEEDREDPNRVGHWMALAREEAQRMNAQHEHEQFEHEVRRPEDD
jgi:hypothetical protein